MEHASRKHAEGLRSMWLFPKAGDIVLARIQRRWRGSAGGLSSKPGDRQLKRPFLIMIGWLGLQFSYLRPTTTTTTTRDVSDRPVTSQPLPVQPVVCCLFVWLATGQLARLEVLLLLLPGGVGGRGLFRLSVSRQGGRTRRMDGCVCVLRVVYLPLPGERAASNLSPSKHGSLSRLHLGRPLLQRAQRAGPIFFWVDLLMYAAGPGPYMPVVLVGTAGPACQWMPWHRSGRQQVPPRLARAGGNWDRAAAASAACDCWRERGGADLGVTGA